MSGTASSRNDDDRTPDRLSLLTEIAERLARVEELGSGEFVVVGTWYPRGGVCVIVLAGEIDLGNAGEISRGLVGELGPWRSSLVIELSHVTFIDSSGINELLQLSRRLTAVGGQVVLAAPSVNVARVLDIVNLGDRLLVASSLEAALARLETRDRPAQRGTEPPGA